MNVISPESVGMSSERLARIAPVMNDFVRDNQLPGILTLIQRRGQIVHRGSFGLMDIEAGKPMRDDALFRLYSMTKPVVSVALMLLYEEGRFGLSDPISRFIPAFKDTKVYAGSPRGGMKLVEQEQPINFHHLLTHTAGLSYGSYFDSPVEDLYRRSFPAQFDRNLPLKNIIDRIAALPLLFQPGTQWRYSCATDVVGYAVEVIADMPLGDFLRQRIFEPLGMTDTDFYVPAAKTSRLAQIYGSNALYDPYVISPEKLMMIGDVTTPTQSPAGGAGLISTQADYLRFCNFLLSDGAYDGGRLISRRTLAMMTADHIADALKPLNMLPFETSYGFGLGFRVATGLGKVRTLTSVGEYGWSGAAKTYFWIDPAEDMIGMMMTQILPTDDYPVNERFRILAYQAIAD